MRNISARILLTLWIGGMWMVGFVVTPTLFQLLEDRALAGTIAGQLFNITAYLGLVCGGLLLLNVLVYSRIRFYTNWRVWTLAGMLLMVAIGLFVITPMISEIRDAGILDTEKARFDLLHRSASILFISTSLAGLILVIFGVNEDRENL